MRIHLIKDRSLRPLNLLPYFRKSLIDALAHEKVFVGDTSLASEADL
jgi:hypothetical protein